MRYYGAQCAAFTIPRMIHDRFNAKQIEGGLEEQLKYQTINLCHPNILKFLHSESSKQLLVTEMVHETVTSLVESQPNVLLHVKLSILLGVSRGLWYLHSRNPPIVRGRLSCNSLVLDDQLEIKISIPRVFDMAIGSAPQSKAQEALQETLTEYNTSVPIDVFSYGRVILHVVNQELPSHCIATRFIVNKI